MKRSLIFLMAMLFASSAGAWGVTTNSETLNPSDVSTLHYRIPQGETREFAFTLSPSQDLSTATIDYLYQTPSMTNWYSITGSNVGAAIHITWSPTNDAGYSRYNGWVRVLEGTMPFYRLQLSLGMLETPGFTPNTTLMPTLSPVDFATLSFTNDPWATLEEVTNIVAAATNLATAFATAAQGTSGDTAFGWGDHATNDYTTGTALALTSAADRVYSDLQDDSHSAADRAYSDAGDAAAGVASSNYTDSVTGTNIAIVGTVTQGVWNGTAVASGYIVEADPIFGVHVAYSITGTQTAQWDTAYGWGDHATNGYLTSYAETDPVWTNAYAVGLDLDTMTNPPAAWLTDTTYTAGTNLTLTAGEFSLDAAAQASDDLADSAMQDLVDDTTPTLGGNLDLNSNTASNGTFAGTHTGGGSGVTNMNGTEIRSGTVADARIASTITRDSEYQGVIATQVWANAQYPNALLLDGTRPMYDTLDINGYEIIQVLGVWSGVSGTDGFSFSVGEIEARVALFKTYLDALVGQDLTVVRDLVVSNNATITGTNTAAEFVGGGAGVTNVDALTLETESASDFHDAAQLTGTIADARLPAEVVMTDENNAYSGTTTQDLSAVVTIVATPTADTHAVTKAYADSLPSPWSGAQGAETIHTGAVKVTAGDIDLDGNTVSNGTFTGIHTGDGTGLSITEVDPIAVLPDGSRPFTADQGLGGNSLTNVLGIYSGEAVINGFDLNDGDNSIDARTDTFRTFIDAEVGRDLLVVRDVVISNDLDVIGTATADDFVAGAAGTTNAVTSGGLVDIATLLKAAADLATHEALDAEAAHGETDPLAILSDGSRPMSGGLGMGNNPVTNSSGIWFGTPFGIGIGFDGSIVDVRGTLSTFVDAEVGQDLLVVRDVVISNDLDVIGTATADEFIGGGGGLANVNALTLETESASDFHDAAQLTGDAPIAVLTNVLSVADGTNIDWNGTTFDLDAAAQASDDLADSSMQDLVDDTTPTLGGPLDADNNSITNISTNSLTFADGGVAMRDNQNLSDLSSASTSRSNLGVAIGSDVQAWDAGLDTLALDDGQNLTNLNAGYLASGTVPNARLDAQLQEWASISTNGGVGEEQLDVSVNASLDLSDTAVQPDGSVPMAANWGVGGYIVSNLDNEAYGAAWNGANEAATKDAVYDKIESNVQWTEGALNGETGVYYVATGGETNWSIPFDTLVQATIGANQSITNDTDTVIQFDTESWDLGADFDAASDYALEVVNDGYYRIHVATFILSIGDGKKGCLKLKEDGTLRATIEKTTGASGNLSLDATVTLYLTNGSQVVASVSQSDVGALSIVADPAYTRFEVERVR